MQMTIKSKRKIGQFAIFKTRIKYVYCAVRNLKGNLSNCSGQKSTKIFGGKIREIFTRQSQQRISNDFDLSVFIFPKSVVKIVKKIINKKHGGRHA
jgi:hypothetical protein